MVSTRCSSFLLTFILLVHVGNSSSGALSAYQAKEITVVAKGSELAVAESMRRLEISDGVPAAMDEVSNTRLGGRKMVLMKRVLREKMKEELLNKEDSRFQNESRLLKAKSENPRSQQTPAKGPVYFKPVSTTTSSSLECSSRYTNIIPQEFDGSSQNLESRKLLDKAAMEIVNLINKDYTGGGGPRQKPPIHNDQPMTMNGQQHDLTPNLLLFQKILTP
ncbi:hypothetical protein GH714_040966 [Hevea brasiliensis]|uniref:Uncharacterized protein n=1 Tax=Hevea brasiliensis TaxID=3981 RepID=A0A6A6ML68_HEVBR|nr:hypothetical protein GH714_040966 [Hevea brasiliensis]